jgi:energy-coupling factor transporter ATP-binding protein EcfA2
MHTNCSAFTIVDFKGFQHETIDLSPITVLVGGNNSGKSSVLQGFHFGVSILQSIEMVGAQNFLSTDLRYCPTSNFLELKRGGTLTEKSGLELHYDSDDGGENQNNSFCQVKVSRGRNGAVSARVETNSSDFRSNLSSSHTPFSIYVPGLSGVPLTEEFRSELVVDNGIARGDANLYLRNVLNRIHTDPHLSEKFHRLLSGIFPDLRIKAPFDENRHVNIPAAAEFSDGTEKSIDLLGTGALQAIQLIAYVVRYNPSVLLLDEPDAHLHPSNQRTLCQVLRAISKQTGVQLILATHSRHFVDEFINESDSSVVWLKDNKVERDTTPSQVSILTDLGGLDEGERILHRDCRALVLTEDSVSKRNSKFINTILAANNFCEGEYTLFSYKTVNKVEAANMLADFLADADRSIHIVIHRDRDFMTNEEVQSWIDLYRKKDALKHNVHIFFTRYSDIEHYFCQKKHLESCLDTSTIPIEYVLSRAIKENTVRITQDFINKREEIKNSPIYRGAKSSAPSSSTLINDQNLGFEHAKGKTLIKFINHILNEEYGINPSQLLYPSDALKDTQLQKVADQIWGAQDIVG